MCSDQGQAMARDGLLDPNNTDPKSVKAKSTPDAPDEMLPQVLQSGKNAGEFDPDWLIVKISDGVPLKVEVSISSYGNEAREEFLPPPSTGIVSTTLDAGEGLWLIYF